MPGRWGAARAREGNGRGEIAEDGIGQDVHPAHFDHHRAMADEGDADVLRGDRIGGLEAGGEIGKGQLWPAPG